MPVSPDDESNASEPETLVMPAESEPTRLDRFIATQKPDLSRTVIRQLFEQGRVRWAASGDRRSRPASKGELTNAGETLWILAPREVEEPEPPPLVVLLERDDIVVVDKPPTIPTAPLPGGKQQTLVGALLARFPEMAGLFRKDGEAGIVHRLDNETSGAVVAARTAGAFQELVAALSEGRLDKRYRLICRADELPNRGTIAFPIAAHRNDRRRSQAIVRAHTTERRNARAASTEFSVLERAGDYALCEASVSRAVRHQIRVHFEAMNSSLAGDVLYRGPDLDGLRRHALHAYSVAYAGGPNVAAFEVIAEWPDDLRTVWQGLSHAHGS